MLASRGAVRRADRQLKGTSFLQVFLFFHNTVLCYSLSHLAGTHSRGKTGSRNLLFFPPFSSSGLSFFNSSDQEQSSRLTSRDTAALLEGCEPHSVSLRVPGCNKTKPKRSLCLFLDGSEGLPCTFLIKMKVDASPIQETLP